GSDYRSLNLIVLASDKQNYKVIYLVEVYRRDWKKLPGLGEPDIDWEQSVYLHLILTTGVRTTLDLALSANMTVGDGEMVCVCILGVVFQGFIRYEALRKDYGNQVSVAAKMNSMEFMTMKWPQGKGHAEMVNTEEDQMSPMHERVMLFSLPPTPERNQKECKLVTVVSFKLELFSPFSMLNVLIYTEPVFPDIHTATSLRSLPLSGTRCSLIGSWLKLNRSKDYSLFYSHLTCITLHQVTTGLSLVICLMCFSVSVT
uniref:Uncharacterized protein n=1 Tax=Cyprinodon variegatus TaxID=28743 RepID=A0A3Q2D634_CYPVA